MSDEVNSLSIIDQTDISTLREDMKKISQWQQLVQSSLKEGHDYGTIQGTSKPTLYKAGAEKIVMLGKLRSTFDVLDSTKDWEKEFFQFEIKCNLWIGEMILTQGVGLCSSKEDKYRYRWLSENKIPSNVNKAGLVYKERPSKYGKGTYKTYRVENDDVCSIANTILKMAKKRALVDAALLVGSLSELFTQDIEDFAGNYVEGEVVNSPPKDNNKGHTPQATRKQTDDPASQAQINLIVKNVIASHLLKKAELEKINKLIENGLTKNKASDIISWWIGDKQNNVIGERAKREAKEKEAKDTKEPKPGSSIDNAIPYKGKDDGLEINDPNAPEIDANEKPKKAHKVSKGSDFISDEDLGGVVEVAPGVKVAELDTF